MGFQPVDRRQAQAFGDSGAFGRARDQVDPLAVANPVERQPVGEILAHAIRPAMIAESGACCSRSQYCRVAAMPASAEAGGESP